MQPIYTQTLGSGGASVVTFNNIPQYFTDIVFLISARTAYNGDADAYLNFQDGSGTTNYSWTKLAGTGSGTSNYRGTSSNTVSPWTLKGDATASTFSNVKISIPNYTSSNFKSVISESVMEHNGTVGWDVLTSGLWRSTSSITSATFSVASGFTQYSTFSLYGVTKG